MTSRRCFLILSAHYSGKNCPGVAPQGYENRFKKRAYIGLVQLTPYFLKFFFFFLSSFVWSQTYFNVYLFILRNNTVTCFHLSFLIIPMIWLPTLLSKVNNTKRTNERTLNRIREYHGTHHISGWQFLQLPK